MVDSTGRRGARGAHSLMCCVAALTIGLAGCTHADAQEVRSVQGAASADPQPADGPAIWRLQDEDTVIYLFGLAGALPPDTEWRSAAFDEALGAADLVILETLTPGPEGQAEVQAAVQSSGLYQDGRTLSSVLDAEDLALVTSVAGNLGVPIQGIDPLKPWLASIQLGVIAVTRQGFDVASTPSAEIEAQARSMNATVEALEGPTDLLLTIAGLDESEQIGMLTHAARDLRDNPDQLTQLNNAWLRGDVGEIGTILHGPNGYWSSDVVYQTMLVSRNAEWSTRVSSVMSEHQGTAFMAVGLGHLAGDDSLVLQLRRAGYEVDRL